MSSRAGVQIEFGGSRRKGPKAVTAEIARETQLPADWGAGLIPAHCHPFTGGWSAIGIEARGLRADFPPLASPQTDFL